MHRCLTIPEIIANICKFNATVDPEVIEHEEDIPSRNSTLQAMSLACRLFHGTSMDYIWSLIITLRPLVKCMSPDIWEETSDGIGEEWPTQHRLNLRRPILSSDMGKFMELARRVRTYGLPEHDGRAEVETEEGPVLCQTLSSANGGRRLFPNLRGCFFFLRHSVTQERLQLIHLVLGPNVHYLRLHYEYLSSLDDTPLKRAQFIVSLSSCCPQLKRIDIDDISLNPGLTDLDSIGVSELICTSNYLTKVTAGRMSAKAIQHLATLPDLRTLDVDLSLQKGLRYIEERFDLKLPKNQGPTFPALEILRLQSSGINVCIDLFSNLPLHMRLREVHLQFHLCKASEWDQLLTRISAACCSNSLTALRIEDRSIRGEVVSQQPLRELFRFSNLVHLELGSASGFDLDGPFVHESAKTWPQ